MGSPYSSIEIFDQIESDIVDFRSEGLLVCMIGDFNVRSGLLSDFISVDQHISDELLDIETEMLLNKNNLDVLGFPSERYSEDYTCNNYGHRFIDLCKSLDVHIANGRLFKDAFIDVHNPIYITVRAEPLPVVEEISNDISDDANNHYTSAIPLGCRGCMIRWGGENVCDMIV
ncbi:hypothetical protein MAR_007891 [Mya arenaria]|uniref:Endonuclease/exonuclease/phosphatase domain-containing protein n=1 Tax=Mya arenaria TaxID=6604 RepID=A0ABY7DUC5_MYAAR|nr:hypothetical protein MAR_007891 [Mya arenaria]